MGEEFRYEYLVQTEAGWHVCRPAAFPNPDSETSDMEKFVLVWADHEGRIVGFHEDIIRTEQLPE